MIKISEDMLQAQCVAWFRLQYPDERFAAIPDYNNKYYITDKGRVFSFKRNRFLGLHKTNEGYLRAHLSDGLKVKCHAVHRLVMFAFGKPDCCKFFVNQIRAGLPNAKYNFNDEHKSELKNIIYLLEESHKVNIEATIRRDYRLREEGIKKPGYMR